ncbi:hypothetical protein OG258_54950 [Streptomyces mirabilis]|uniref:hypothetical protein n=1 Tax=Streptomyces mirabilis TaxID=68239 RepID=UPI002E2AFEA9|nr:hypothetical protein [Streptomyces mirabilis]
MGKFSQCGLYPVLAELGMVVLTEVVDRGIHEEGLWKVQPHSETTRVHGDLQDRSRRGRTVLEPAQQLRRPREVLCHTPITASPAEGISQETVSIPSKSGRCPQSPLVEGFWDGEHAVSEQFPHSTMGVRGAGARQGSEPIRVLRPQSGQDEHWLAFVFSEQAVQGGCDPLAAFHGAEVVLSFVQPHHRERLYTHEIGESGLCARGVEGVPQSPSLIGKRLNRFPARSCLASGRGADQDHHPAFALLDISHCVSQ